MQIDFIGSVVNEAGAEGDEAKNDSSPRNDNVDEESKIESGVISSQSKSAPAWESIVIHGIEPEEEAVGPSKKKLHMYNRL